MGSFDSSRESREAGQLVSQGGCEERVLSPNNRKMFPPKLAGFLSAAAVFLGAAPAPTTAQAVYGISERIPPFTPLHTAIYTTTLLPVTQKQSPFPQVITTVVVTLFVPRDVGYPTNTAPVTATAVSHFSAAERTWAETAHLAWTLAGNNANNTVVVAPNAQATVGAVYTDYSHYTTEMYGAWSQAWFNYVSTYRETIIEDVGGESYPATMIHTGRTTIEITVTGGTLVRGQHGAATTTFTNPATLVSVRTTTLILVQPAPTPGPG